MRANLIIPVIALCTALAGCTEKKSQTAAVPKPAAYPRIADPGTQYVVVDSLPVNLLANAEATVSRPRPDWIDISYPELGATVHVSLTMTSPDDIARVIDNRSERIALNVAGVSSTAETTIESPDFTSVIISSPETRSTPLQFLSHNGKSLVISGTAFFGNVSPEASIDSLAPIVSYINRDLTHALSNLKAL